MAASWRRCQKCRKVLPVDDFEGDSEICRADASKAAAATTVGTRASVTTRVTTTRPRVPTTPPRDIRGHGDVEVRARRARSRALDRLSEVHAEEFAEILREERASEGL